MAGNRGLKAAIAARFRLAKGWLSLMLGLAAMFGYLLASSRTGPALLLAGAVAVLAGGAASLNSLQDREGDRRMRRTKLRPLPQGELAPAQALRQAGLLIACGLLLLATFPGPLPVTLGAVAIGLYNGIYTPLKARSMLALVPGAVCGGLPPVIGWLAGGGRTDSPVVVLLMALLILWQIPHFWLLSLRYRDDYLAAAPPNLLQHLSESALRRLLVPWVGALAAVMSLFALLPLGVDGLSRAVIIGIAASLVSVFVFQAMCRPPHDYRALFIFLNLMFFLFFLAVGAARLSHDPGSGRPSGTIVRSEGARTGAGVEKSARNLDNDRYRLWEHHPDQAAITNGRACPWEKKRSAVTNSRKRGSAARAVRCRT